MERNGQLALYGRGLVVFLAVALFLELVLRRFSSPLESSPTPCPPSHSSEPHLVSELFDPQK